ncbi:DNA-binding transcriptional MerR regulator [Kitasatospora sp. GP30]|uniref:MerR family transcriptional regulator n=1 Tax=Kitasatospora sp. GP30 TaxID=3035084 RepID=UPI000C70CEEE|nr:MerR family transcriptional regulator [Kitasatospora sp. GP30]MDH6144921.1 DNA-binding transcriptional MerR regulator [Kitasatospora sp. GP30]
MSNGDTTRYSIGELARRTGLAVRTIRFYADEGIVPPTDRSPSGYRRYDEDAAARLDLVRTLRDLGIDLPTIRRILDRETTLPEVAELHARAIEAQLGMLRQRLAVLRAVAKRGASVEETDLMHRLAQLSDAERRSIISDFVEEVFAGLDANPALVAMMRAAMPELPEEPTVEQVEAWVELGELAQDPDFRAAVRRMAEYQAAERAAGDTTGLHHELTQAVREQVGRALTDGLAPDSPAGAAVLDSLTAQYAQVFARPDDTELRHWLLRRLDVAGDPRTERYWQLLSIVNGWPVPESLAPVMAWLAAALRAAPTA